MKCRVNQNRNFIPHLPDLRHLLRHHFRHAIFQIIGPCACHINSQYNAVMKTSKATISSPTNQRIAKTDTLKTRAEGLHALLDSAPKRIVVMSRETVRTNKSDILKALRRGHRVEDIAQALSIPMRTFVRRLKELNIAARLVRKQYKRSD